MAITIIESKRGVNWLIGNDKSREKGEKRKATLHSANSIYTPLKKTLLKKTVRSKRVQGCLPFLSFFSRLIVSD
jgi:hypothetical protein